MKLPRKTKQWAKESAKALEFAFGLAVSEYGELNKDAKENLYKYGPMICAQNRGIKDEGRIKSAALYAFEERLNDFRIDPDSIDNYSINFFLSYLDSHVALEYISENKVHDIMEYLVDNFEIPH
jgi:hypothetical protein